MTNIKLFKIHKDNIEELHAHYPSLERKLQNLIEKNLETLLGIQCVASEFATTKGHGGRIDTLGIDENNCPVIIEYKRSSNENIINQGLFYLDWLLDHKKDFEFLVIEKLGKSKPKDIDWSSPRLLCIAANFTKYDEYAIKQIARNIELIRYRYFSADLLLLELVNDINVSPMIDIKKQDKNIEDSLKVANQNLLDLYNELKIYVFSLGDDIQLKQLKHYHAFRKLRNFLCVEIFTRNQELALYLNINPSSIALEEGFTRDVTNIGHRGTGNLEIIVSSMDALHKAKELIQKSYDNS